jgi:hypothetical protein
VSDQILTAQEQGRLLVVSYWQDVEPHLREAERARREDSETRTRFGRRAELRRTMHVPNNVWLQVCEKLGIPFGRVLDKDVQERIMRELKGPEYKHFRTTVDVKI